MMDQLSAYGKHPDPLYYVTRFMDGLKPNVRLMVAIQLPESLDTTYQLALLHEELGDGSTPFNSVHDQRRVPIPAYAPAKAPVEKIQNTTHRATEDKWVVLRNFRRAKGLCYTCGEKWGRKHKCGGTIQLHVVQ